MKKKFAPLLSLFGSAYGPNKTANLIFLVLSTHRALSRFGTGNLSQRLHDGRDIQGIE